MHVCYVLAYRSPDYIRTKTLLDALRNMPGVECVTAINRERGLWRYKDTLAQVYSLKKCHSPDVYILGFRGHELYWPLRWLVGGTPIILDAMMSPYSALLDEQKFGLLGTIGARVWFHVEKSILHDSQSVITDTELHRDYFSKTFALAREKIVSVPVGAVLPAPPSGAPSTRAAPDPDQLRVLFYGSFLPLHGVDIILQAAKICGALPLHFIFIGGDNKTERKLSQVFRTCARARYSFQSWMPFESLIKQELLAADISLGGPFGDTPQARRVVTGKAQQSLAAGIATIIGKIDEAQGFRDKENCLLVPQGSAQELAAALMWAYTHKDQLSAIGIQGRLLYHTQFSREPIQRALSTALSAATAFK